MITIKFNEQEIKRLASFLSFMNLPKDIEVPIKKILNANLKIKQVKEREELLIKKNKIDEELNKI